MKKQLFSLLLAVFIGLAVSAPAKADFQKGVNAYLESDFETAFQEFSKAARDGNAKAQYNLGVMYANGEGVSQDYAEAARYYRLAAEQGDAKAQYNLGVMYAIGEGVLQDYLRAHMWVNIAIRNGADRDNVRSVIEKKLSSSQIVKAQEMARNCLNSGYKNC